MKKLLLLTIITLSLAPKAYASDPDCPACLPINPATYTTPEEQPETFVEQPYEQQEETTIAFDDLVSPEQNEIVSGEIIGQELPEPIDFEME